MIKFENISLDYNGKNVFNDFNFSMKTGEKIVLTAPSGKGKSSLLKMLLGFTIPSKGNIYVDNHKLNSNNISLIRSKLAYVSQDIDLTQETVQDIINQVLSYKINKNINMNKEKILEWIAYFELDQDILDKKTQDLSGGERQRVGLIICILLDRDIWLLDEITSGLDPKMKDKVVLLLAKIKKPMIIVSHDPIWGSQECFRLETW